VIYCEREEFEKSICNCAFCEYNEASKAIIETRLKPNRNGMKRKQFAAEL